MPEFFGEQGTEGHARVHMGHSQRRIAVEVVPRVATYRDVDE